MNCLQHSYTEYENWKIYKNFDIEVKRDNEFRESVFTIVAFVHLSWLLGFDGYAFSMGIVHFL